MEPIIRQGSSKAAANKGYFFFHFAGVSAGIGGNAVPGCTSGVGEGEDIGLEKGLDRGSGGVAMSSSMMGMRRASPSAISSACTTHPPPRAL